jgi:hypothetical protein
VNDEPDLPDFIDAIAYEMKSAGIGYLEAQSMVRDMLAEAWDSMPDLADLDPITSSLH